MVQGPNPSWEGAGDEEFGGKAPETKHFACLSINFACNFVQERSGDAKKISQPVTFSHTGRDHLPYPPPSTRSGPVAEWYRVGSNRVTCFNHYRGNCQNSAH